MRRGRDWPEIDCWIYGSIQQALPLNIGLQTLPLEECLSLLQRAEDLIPKGQSSRRSQVPRPSIFHWMHTAGPVRIPDLLLQQYRKQNVPEREIAEWQLLLMRMATT